MITVRVSVELTTDEIEALAKKMKERAILTFFEDAPIDMIILERLLIEIGKELGIDTDTET